MAMKCPKCGFEQEESSTCINCGVIFEKFRQTQTRESNEEQPEEDIREPRHKRTAGKHISSSIISTILIVAVLSVGVLVYLKLVEPYIIDADNFKDSLMEFGAEEFDIPRDYGMVTEGEIPYRTGKLFVIIPQYKFEIIAREFKTYKPEIHSVWYKLGRSIRARSPEEVDTLIRVRRKFGNTEIYTRDGGLAQKVGLGQRLVSYHIHYLDVFDLRDQTYIGTWTIDPGKNLADYVTDEELKNKIEATSDTAILNIIESMPVK